MPRHVGDSGIDTSWRFYRLFSLSRHFIYRARHPCHHRDSWHHICHRIRFQRDVFQKS